MSAALVGKSTGHGFGTCTDPRQRQFWTPEKRAAVSVKLAEYQRAKARRQQETASWGDLSRRGKKVRVVHEQGGACLCGVREWNGAKLRLEFHHEDGDNTNDARENVSMLCPNCHSQTPTYRANRRLRAKVSRAGKPLPWAATVN